MHRDPLGSALAAVWAAGHIAAATLLGVTVYDQVGPSDESTAAAPDVPLTDDPSSTT
jgi:hypothetical protein